MRSLFSSPGYLATESGRLLDVGCGSGVFLYGFRQRFPAWHVVGIEPTKDFADVARKQGIEIVPCYLQADAFSVVFDLITLIHVVEHLDRASDLLRIVKGYLKPGGLIYIECPSDQDIGRLPLSHARFMCQHDVIHSEDSLQRLILKAEFRPIWRGTFISRRGRQNVRIIGTT